MTLRGVDISNLQGLPESYRSQQWYQVAEFVIIQAIPRPKPNGIATVQLRAAKADGKYTGIYSWLWHDPAWRLSPKVAEDQRLRLATVLDDVPIDMRPWLDEEDNQSAGWANVSIQTRKDEVLTALDVLSEWGARRGLPRAGIYWSRYFIDLLFGGDDSWLPAGTVQWLAHYSAPPGSLIGGNVVAHQYTSTPIDKDEMLESEIVAAEPDPEEPMLDCEAAEKKAADLVNALGYVAGDVLRPLTRKNAAAYVKKAVEQIRAVAEQQGVSHA